MQDPDIDDLVSPDAESSETYRWDEDFQRHIIALLLVDKQFLVQSVDLIKPSYFTNKAHKEVCRVLFEHYHKYKLVPNKTFILEELKNVFKEDKSKLLYLSEVNSLYEYFEPALDHREYLSDKIVFFAKMMSLKNAFTHCLKEIDKDPESAETWAKVYDTLRKAMNVDRNFETGLDYFGTTKERYERMAETETDGSDKFVTGYEGVDKEIKGGGYNRGEMIAVIAPSGVGKSVMLTNMARTNVLRNKKVLYVTLELSEDRQAERFDAIFADSNIHALYDNKDSIFAELEQIVEDKQDKKLVIVKYFAPKTCTVNVLRAYISQLKFYGFVPDMVVLDYIGEMKDYPDMKVHESRELIISELRGLANEGEKFFCAVAIQPNRSSKLLEEHQAIEDEHMADSFGQIRPLDGALSINQSKNEAQVNIGRGWVMKQRFGRAKYYFYLEFDRQSLRIKEISQQTYRNRQSSRTEKVSEETAIDNIVTHFVPSDAAEEGDKK
jgi:replicative DNA helicase